MNRKIIVIDEDKCDGCGLCINACHEEALQLVNGKAKLIKDSYCDGLGACLPNCPKDAIKIEEREAEAFDEEDFKRRVKKEAPVVPTKVELPNLGCGCPGSRARVIEKAPTSSTQVINSNNIPAQSQLRQWPVQIKLVPANAPYFDNAHLLVAADCTAFAYPDIHNTFMKNKITIIGCPKLDDVDYSDKLAQILSAHEIKSLTILRMEVPCCGGIVQAAKQALLKSGKMIPWNVVVISTDGTVLDQ